MSSGPLFLSSRSSTFYPQNKGKAERVGFEPTRRLYAAYAISSRAPSANSDTSPENAFERVYQISFRALREGGPQPPLSVG
jgi:hypothetical protein